MSVNNTNKVRSFIKTQRQARFEYESDGGKKWKMLKLFNNYVIEVKEENGKDKIVIYDVDNRKYVCSEAFKTVHEIEIEYEQTSREEGKSQVGRSGVVAKDIYVRVSGGKDELTGLDKDS